MQLLLLQSSSGSTDPFIQCSIALKRFGVTLHSFVMLLFDVIRWLLIAQFTLLHPRSKMGIVTLFPRYWELPHNWIYAMLLYHIVDMELDHIYES